MDKAKMHEKQPEVGSRSSKPGDFSQWHGNMFKRSGHESDFFAQPYLPAMPLPYPLPLWSHPLFPNFTSTAMPQYPVPTHEQESSEEGFQQGGTQTCASDRSESPEVPGPNVGAARKSCQSASSAPNHDNSHMGGARPFNLSGGFVFPPPYPGQPDPLMVWMHHMQRQVAYLYSMSACRNGYQRPTPITSNGTNQRGYIKIPAGIPQKQSRLWETQSTENMQLWATVNELCATVARAEAEIFCQRGKILKLEDDLQLMKARQDAMSEALKSTTTVSPPIKRVRRKRTTTAPVAILGLPASQPLLEKLQVKKARGLVSESDTLKGSTYAALEGRSEGTLNSSLECTNRSMPEGTGNCLSSIVDLDKKESQSDLPSKDTLERQLANTDSASVVDVVLGEENQDIHIRGSIPGERTKETASPQSMEIKQECSTEVTDEVDRRNEGQVSSEQAVHSANCITECGVMKRGEPFVIENRADQALLGKCNKNSELVRTMSKDDWLEGMVEGPMEGGLLRASSVVERPNTSDDGNQVLCAGESLVLKSPEQQTGEVKDIRGACPDDLAVTNMSDYIVLYPETSVFKEPLI